MTQINMCRCQDNKALPAKLLRVASLRNTGSNNAAQHLLVVRHAQHGLRCPAGQHSSPFAVLSGILPQRQVAAAIGHCLPAHHAVPLCGLLLPPAAHSLLSTRHIACTHASSPSCDMRLGQVDRSR